MWGGVLNVVRNITRVASSPWGFPPEERAMLEMFARWVIAMPYCLRAHMKKIPVAPDLETILLPEELEYLTQAMHPCLRCSQVAFLTPPALLLD